ncbi:ATP-binding protein [Promicromonospora sp. NPDC057488]|uniref:ATP-binding protein n=1 Tax=Promicromonospora sp. NPDC057488 TaxID=3346147 RepID=UPI00366B22D9
MAASKNPFKPSAGATPPHLVGRDDQVAAVADGIDEGPGSPGRLTIFTGARGVGKTTLLNAVDDVALEHGWLFVDETATAGLMGRLDEHVSHMLEERRPRPKRRLTGINLSASFGGVSTELTPELSAGLRRKLNTLLDDLERHDSGLLLTIDEVHVTLPDMREIAALAQHMVREQRQFALVMAGLPSAVSGLLSDDVLTFLRRADKHVLGDVSIDEVHDALVATFEENGRAITPEASWLAAEATFGYPFLIQLVCYHVWRATDGDVADLAAVDAGISAARRRLGSLVHETALADLSDLDRTFLVAMSVDDGPSRMADVRRRMGEVSPQHANTYRRRLMAAGMIQQVSHGKVAFALPYLRDFLREHGAAYGLGPDEL